MINEVKRSLKLWNDQKQFGLTKMFQQRKVEIFEITKTICLTKMFQ
jgi:hypothetical protein